MDKSNKRVAKHREKLKAEKYKTISITLDPKTHKEIQILKKNKKLTYLELIQSLLEDRKKLNRIKRKK